MFGKRYRYHQFIGAVAAAYPQRHFSGINITITKWLCCKTVLREISSSGEYFLFFLFLLLQTCAKDMTNKIYGSIDMCQTNGSSVKWRAFYRDQANPKPPLP